MPDGITVLTFLVALYFLVAAFVPRIRLRWGYQKGISFDLSRAGIRKAKWTFRLPRMTACSCFGFFIFATGLGFSFLFPRKSFADVICGGVVIIVIGFLIDGSFDPPKYRKH